MLNLSKVSKKYYTYSLIIMFSIFFLNFYRIILLPFSAGYGGGDLVSSTSVVAVLTLFLFE